jgi:hypothetical protein
MVGPVEAIQTVKNVLWFQFGGTFAKRPAQVVSERVVYAEVQRLQALHSSDRCQNKQKHHDAAIA